MDSFPYCFLNHGLHVDLQHTFEYKIHTDRVNEITQNYPLMSVNITQSNIYIFVTKTIYIDYDKLRTINC